MSGVKFQRLELTEMIQTYRMIEDAITGEKAVKKQKSKYLPVPSYCTKGVVDDKYNAYITRALYVNYTRPTRDALVGQLFLRAPIVEVPEQLKPALENMNGEGLNLEQVIRLAANHVLPYGRGGLLTDFPPNQSEITVGEIERGEKTPVIKFYAPWAIRNWHSQIINNKEKLLLVVLDEVYEVYGSDGFTVERKIQHRVYSLLNNKCYFRLYQEDNVINEGFVLDANGVVLDFIPFDFIGSENNDSRIDDPPFENLATVNIAHYRNSADYEESVYLVGQPTPVYTGLTEDWVDNYFADGVPFGSRASVPLPVGATAELLQAKENSLAYEAMGHKEKQMVAIGAKIINPENKVEKKEKEVEIEAASQRSVLTTIKENLEKAFTKALKVAASFVGVTDAEIKLVLNENFDLTSMAPDEIRVTSELYTGNMITFAEMRESLHRSGIAKTPDDEALATIEKESTIKAKLNPVGNTDKSGEPGTKKESQTGQTE